jgi:hypothetical protein
MLAMIIRPLSLKTTVVFSIALVFLQPYLAGFSPRPQITSSPNSPPYVGSEFQITGHTWQTEIGGEHPAAAFNSNANRFLVVWENLGSGNREIYGQLVSPGGLLLGNPIAISIGGYDHIRPCVAFSSIENEYMVLWMYDASSDGSRFEIWGQRISWDGQLVGETFQVKADGALSFWSPRLAWSNTSNLYLLAWSARDGSSTPVEIGMETLYADGSIHSEHSYNASDVHPFQPDVTYNPVDGYFLVVWTQQNSNESYSVIGDLRDFDGNRVKPDVFTIYTQEFRPLLNPRAAFGSGLRYVIVFELEFNEDDHDVYRSLIDRYANNPPSTVPIAWDYIDEISPQVAADKDHQEFMIVYQSGDDGSRQLWLHPDGSSSIGENLVCAKDDWNCTQPALIHGKANNLLIYSGSEPGSTTHIYGKFATAQAVFIPDVRRRR